MLRHRIACNFTAQAEGITTDKVIEKLLQAIPKTEKLTTAPVTVKAFEAKEKTVPSSLTHISFATWNDGPGTFFIDNVR